MSVRQSLLAILDRGACYGSQLRAEYERRTGAAVNVGQVYTTLERLERDGLVEGAGVDDEARVLWQPTDAGESAAENVIGSVLMVLTMSDPPRLEPRALPILIGVAAALLGLAGVRGFRELPLNVSLLCVAGIAGAFVARGSAYPGRFSIHLIPVTVALTMCAVRLVLARPRPAPRRP